METTGPNIKQIAETTKDIFQKEKIYNKILPYASELQEEANIMLRNIKVNLSISVSNCEIRPGCEIWMKRLKKYIIYYGMRFSKEDHVAFIHLFYELLLIPYLEPYLFGECARLLRRLLKKTELLSPEDLVLEWKPLYNVCKSILFCSKVEIGMYGYSSTIEEDFILVIHEARHYFPASATQEMLNEWMPLLCPLDNTSFDNAIRLMTYFFPMVLPQSIVKCGHKLWFEDIMNLWEVCNSSSIWDGHIMDLLSFLAENNIGYIDWEPYIPLMFNRFLSCFRLPVSYKNVSVGERYHWDVTAVACWIVSVLGGGSKAQQYLDNLMASLESYFHPVNSGRWTSSLSKLLQGLTSHFIRRLHFERYKKLTWETPVPEGKKLSESDIDNFVLSLKGVALQSMLSDTGEVKMSLQFLATLRPMLIATDIIEYFYTSLETSTNPTKYKAVLQCLTVVIRPILDSQCPISAGASHIIPLLWAVLPGIDPNDWDKSITSLQFVDTVISMVPVVDCSKALELHKNLTEDEKALCLETVNFENLILEFFEHCFLLISSSSSLDSTRLEQGADKQSKFENLAQESLLATCSTVLRQTSTPIFKAALTKLYCFVKSNILETKVAGRLLAGIMQSFVQTNAEATLEQFIPFLSHNILHSSSMDDISSNFVPSSEFLFYLQLVSKIVNCPGKYLLPHMSVLNEVLKKCLQIKTREGFTMASTLLHDMIRSLLTTVPLEFHSVPYSLDEPFKDYVPIKDWGRAGEINNLNLNFFVPGDDEIKCVKSLIDTHLPNQMEMIETLVNSNSPKIDEKLEYCLEAITSLLECRCLLPAWDDELQLMDTCLSDSNKVPLPQKHEKQQLEKDSVILSLRNILVDVLEKLQALLLTLKEYDTKSLIVLTKIWSLLLNNNHFNKSKHDIRFKNYRILKKSQENKLLGQKKHLRFLLITRVQLQHEMLQDRVLPCFTSTHKRIMLNLLTLSTSNYSDVRREARIKLFLALEKFPHSYKVLIPSLCGYLSKDAITEHGMFDGALRVVLGPTHHPILVRHDWYTLQSIWPILLKAKPEKETILSLFDTVEETVEDDFGTATISLDISERCVDVALQLGKDEKVQLITDRKEIEILNTKNNISQYFSLLHTIVNTVQSENLHCRFQCLAMNFLMGLVHPVVCFPSEVVKCFLEFLINDSIELRKYAILSVVMVFKQQKSVHKKIKLDPYSFLGEIEKPAVVYPGDRPDNQWVKFKSKNLPQNKDDWDKTYFLHREYHGYYCWPEVLTVYAPATQQPPFKVLSALNDAEKEIHKFFNDSSSINKLLSFFTLEEKKGEDKFCDDRFLLFKGLFRNFGYEFLEVFVPHLQTFVKSSQESCQRCAAEMISAAVRGAKHWPYEMLQKAWDSLSPLIRDALQHMNEDTVQDWKTCFALASENRDPRWNHWLFKVIIEDQGQPNSSFSEAKRIYCIETALAFHLWRLSEVLTSWLEVLKKRLSHNFQNVRNHVGEALCRIFEADFMFPNSNPPNSPRIKDFMSYILPPILKLYAIASNEGQILDNKQADRKSKENETRKALLTSEHVLEIRLLKTACVWVSTMIDKCVFGITSDFYLIFPTLCLMENYKSDSELKPLCTNTLGKIARTTHLSQHLTPALEAIKKASHCTSWQSRVTCTEFVQVFVFYNMPIILSNSTLSGEIRKLVLELLEDKCLEVREKSSEVLCGLLHTGFIKDQITLLNTFKEKIGNLRSKKPQSGEQTSLRFRHSALLGLCAFIDAHPYDVPDFIPDLFVILQKHLSDPHPIPVTVRKTICNFQRTHYDNWSQYKYKFNEEQLSILADLTTGPTYYA